MEIASFIDHTFLKPTCSASDINKICEEALAHKFFSVCIPPSFVSQAKSLLKDSNVKVCTVVGFPWGLQKTDVKVFETEQAIKDGADEIDMVINIGSLTSGKVEQTTKDIQQVVAAAKPALVKVILETCLLTDEQIASGCQAAKKAQADFVKTSTGFSTGGASLENIKLMRKAAGKEMGVKASGGIKNKQQALAMIEAGANRLGTSSGVAIVQNTQGEGNY